MAIQNRRGQSADFVASKMVPGEFAVSQDNRKLYLCFTAGNVKEIAIAEDMANAIAEMNLAMEEWHDEVVEDTEDKVEDAEAWAQGTRGGTPVPSTDPTYQHNAKYYAENIVDNTLSIAGKAADAKKTGDEISDLKDDIDAIEPGLSDDAKVALLNCFRHTAWADGGGQSYYNALYAAIYPDLVPTSISAVFTQGSATIYDTDSLNVLRQYLTVTAIYADGRIETVTDYELRGTLTSGTSTITVWYETKTTTFIVAVTHDSVPDVSAGDIVQGYYFNNSGEEVASTTNCINRTYFDVEPNKTYKWIQGFMGNTKPASGWLGSVCGYRILYYDANKTFISREVNSWSTTWEFIEPRYYEFTTPNNAKYIRVSWGLLPAGRIVNAIPSELYAVTLVLAYLDDSTISDLPNLYNRVSIYRNGNNITSNVIWNGKNISSDLIPYYWRNAIFNVNTGGTPEAGPQNVSDTRIFNQKSFLLETGDVIKFNNVKYGVRCEKISDGSLTHTSEWVTDNSDYVIGGEN